MRSRGLPEVPMGIEPDMRRFLTALRESVNTISMSPPEPITNFVVTPIAGGNVVEFTRSNAESYHLLWSRTPDISFAAVIDLGTGARYQHVLGEEGATIYYWIKARQANGGDTIVGPVSGTTLALGTPITAPDPPPQSTTQWKRPGGGVEIGRDGLYPPLIY